MQNSFWQFQSHLLIILILLCYGWSVQAAMWWCASSYVVGGWPTAFYWQPQSPGIGFEGWGLGFRACQFKSNLMREHNMHIHCTINIIWGNKFRIPTFNGPSSSPMKCLTGTGMRGAAVTGSRVTTGTMMSTVSCVRSSVTPWPGSWPALEW